MTVPPPSRSSLAIALVLVLSPALAGSLAGAVEALTAHDLARLEAVSAAAIAPDGGAVAYLRSVPRDPFEEEDGTSWRELHLVDSAGRSRPYVTGEVTVGSLSWSADGTALFFLAKRDGDEHTALYRIPVGGGEARRWLAHEGESIEAYSLAPDGKRVAFLAKAGADEEREELAEKGFDREIFEEELRPVHVWVAEPEGEDAAVRLELEGSASELHWAPTGERLAVALAPTPLVDDRYMKRQVYVVDAASGEVLAHVEREGKLGQVAWSPDGRRLAMISAADLHDPAPGRLLVADAAGGVARDVLPSYPGHVAAIAWADSETLVYIGDRGVWTGLESVAASGGEPQPLAPLEGPVWSGLSLSRGGEAAALVGETPAHPGEVFVWRPGAAEPPRRLTDSNPWLAERRLGRQEPVRWKARDGLEIEGILVRPVVERDGGGHPLVVMVHGGPESHRRNGWLTSYSRPSQVLAGLGFAVVYPNYRGSTGRGVEFSKSSQGDPAGREFDDIVDGVDHLIASGLVDGKRVGVTGGSYGGYATAWMSTYYSERFAAGVMFVGISNEISKVGTSDIPNELNWVHLRHWPWENWQLALERSPIYHAEKAQTPLLIAHGRKDTRVFPGQSMELYRLLKTLGKTPVRLVLYPEEGHGNRRAAARLDYSLRLIRWMSHYLGIAGAPSPDEPLALEDPRESNPAAGEPEPEKETE